jgi:hypothetical protein
MAKPGLRSYGIVAFKRTAIWIAQIEATSNKLSDRRHLNPRLKSQNINHKNQE